MCILGGGGGGGHPAGQNIQYPVRGGFRGWTPGTGPGRGKITGRPAIDLEAYDMCIISGPGSNGHQPHTPARPTARGQAGRGHMRGSMGQRGPGRRNFARLLARLGAHPLGDVVAGRLRLREWVRFELTPSAHDPACRYRRLVQALGVWT